ncbi:MAG: type II secretion system secretin GspD [Planctomycetota bacterium]|jgi:general secretion pathway protein D
MATILKDITVKHPAQYRSAVCLICGLSLILTGCQSPTKTVSSVPQIIDKIKPVEKIQAKATSPQQIESFDTIDGVLAQKDTATAMETLKQPKPYEESISLSKPEELQSTIQSTDIELIDELELDAANQEYFETLNQGTEIMIPALKDPAMADELISVNFDQVDIRIMLKTVGEITGINFIVDENVKGKVTVMSPTKVRIGDLYQVLESVLDVQGYAAVASGNFVKIVPRTEAIKRNLQVRYGGNPVNIPITDTVVTQIIPLKYADAMEVTEIIKPLLAVGAHMATYPRTRSILITDTSANIHHMAKIIQSLDVTGSKEKASVINLKFASAEILSEQITDIMQKGKSVSRGPGLSKSQASLDTQIKILPNLRTNSLIIVANDQDTQTIAQLAHKLDIQRPRGTNNVHVVFLKNAPAKETAESLTSSYLQITGAIEAGRNVQVTAYESTNALIITASAQDFEVISEIIEKLDIVADQVLVEMFIMEVSEDSLHEIGIDWATLDQAVEGGVRGFAATNFGVRSGFVSGDLEGLAMGLWRGSGSNVRIGTILHALDKSSGVNILSTPSIMTLNHQRAKIVVGENIPYIRDSRIVETTDLLTPTVINTFDYKDVGITLEIVPHISQGGLVKLEVDSKFTKLIEGVTGSNVDTPTTAKREAKTTVSLKSDSTVVIGGLMRDDKVTVVKKVPFLSDIPLIGELFKLKRDQLQKTNLLIFITPHILRTQGDLEQITERKKTQIEPAVEDIKKDKNQL